MFLTVFELSVIVIVATFIGYLAGSILNKDGELK